MSCQTSLAIEGPINSLPYDVLSDIFTYCTVQFIPSIYLDTRRKWTKLTPITLSHISSFWRMVALNTPLLWSRLYYRFTVVTMNNGSATAELYERHFLQSDIDFIRWWKGNHKSIAPFLAFDIKYIGQVNATQAHLLARDDDLDFILRYLATSKHLQVDDLFWRKFRKWIELGNQVVLPNLHTLIHQPENRYYEDNDFLQSHTRIGLSSDPTAIFPLRRLCLHDATFELEETSPVHWSSLVEISFDDIYDVDLQYWNSLIRPLQHLRWGFFTFSSIYLSNNTLPTTLCILSHLETLYVGHYDDFDPDQFPIPLLFTNIHLPALRVLSLSSLCTSWENQNAITLLHSVFSSTPNITTLILGENFLSLESSDFGQMPLSANIEPIWRHAPQLMHLRFELRDVHNLQEAQDQLDNVIKNIVDFGNMWLGQENPACPILTVIIVSNALYWTKDPDFVPLRVRILKARYPNIEFQLTRESVRVEASRRTSTLAYFTLAQRFNGNIFSLVLEDLMLGGVEKRVKVGGDAGKDEVEEVVGDAVKVVEVIKQVEKAVKEGRVANGTNGNMMDAGGGGGKVMPSLDMGHPRYGRSLDWTFHCRTHMSLMSAVIALYANINTSLPIYISGSIYLFNGILPLLLPRETMGNAAL
ncbi:hypothetical protein BDN70DRAFT_925199 [Pholiota conissans]|uniref:F-box domain-containing protein n=1 Tax=Pholiota conissans TaxID=109636 RepID=A0A9P5YQ50_9AGAR|nr:hypothetical protein BDN70DRAFT_925199 [Pholiota conissans]